MSLEWLIGLPAKLPYDDMGTAGPDERLLGIIPSIQAFALRTNLGPDLFRQETDNLIRIIQCPLKLAQFQIWKIPFEIIE